MRCIFETVDKRFQLSLLYYFSQFEFNSRLYRPGSSNIGSAVVSYEDLELAPVKLPPTETTPLENPLPRRTTIKKLVRQQSVMDTQRAADGTMQMTYWF